MSEIEIKSCDKLYGNFHALNNLSLNVGKGQIFAYLGPNGAGKTTTIKLLLGLIKPSSGEVKILNMDPYNDNEKSIKNKQKIGVMLDSPALYLDLTGFENLVYWAELYGLNSKKANKIADKLLKKLKLHDWRDNKVLEYSHGMKKRLSFARAIVHDPEILILDEPTNGIDFESRELIRNLIEKLFEEEKTIFFSSHDLGEVQKICTHLAIINKGKMIFHGELKDLEHEFSMNKMFIVLKNEKAVKKFINNRENMIIEPKVDGTTVSFIYAKQDIDLKSEDIITYWIEKTSLEDYYKKIIACDQNEHQSN
ncbi:MAG: Trehalose/maltose import ATP-binding protein MalK [Methanobrevibacter sp. CfCl-M3]